MASLSDVSQDRLGEVVQTAADNGANSVECKKQNNGGDLWTVSWN